MPPVNMGETLSSPICPRSRVLISAADGSKASAAADKFITKSARVGEKRATIARHACNVHSIENDVKQHFDFAIDSVKPIRREFVGRFAAIMREILALHVCRFHAV